MTADFSIVFDGNNKHEPLGFADVSWASDLDSRRSTTGYVFFINNSVVSWKSKRQPTVATSSTEAEYMASYSATQEAVWLHLLLSNRGIVPEAGTTIYEDNQGCITLQRTRCFTQEKNTSTSNFIFFAKKVVEDVIELEYVPTDQMVADGLTKELGRVKHEKFLKGLHLET
uniref:Uncharacterized protein n=1 Tax=Peronospora matthiolae TaxID=2874970 RepID=A0AAV1VDW8_9STRA